MKITAVTPFVVDPGYGKNWLFVKVETVRRPARLGRVLYPGRSRPVDRGARRAARTLPAWARRHATSTTSPTGRITTSRPSAAPWTSAARSAGSSRRSGTSPARRSACRSSSCSAGRAASGSASTPTAGIGERARRGRRAPGRTPSARGFTALKFDPFPGPWRTHISTARSRRGGRERARGARGGRAEGRAADRGAPPAGADARGAGRARARAVPSRSGSRSRCSAREPRRAGRGAAARSACRS